MTEPERDANNALSVSQALSIAKGALEAVTVRILGEVSEVSNKPGYKAVYFSIKDDASTLPCMMWMNRYNASGVEIRVGSLLEISGRFSLYAAKGRMNFDVFSISLAGEGNLRLKVANLAKKLQAQGLMEPSRKRPIPLYPERIGVVTSPRGAAVHDVFRTLRRRFPLAKISFAGVPVEGANAAQNLILGLEAVAASGVDVILLVRGGGSFEDLMPFNDEKLAYTIASSSVPIVTGIGHEPDTSIADMVADLRASTPTAAAESVSPAMDETSRMLQGYMRRMSTSQLLQIRDLKKRLDVIEAYAMFRDPMQIFSEEAQAIDDLSTRLASSMPNMLLRLKDQIQYLSKSFAGTLARANSAEKTSLCSIAPRLVRAGEVMLSPYVANVALVSSRLEDLSPLQVLARGYSIAKLSTGEILSSIGNVEKGDSLDVVVSDGVAHCEVQSSELVEITMEEFDISKNQD